jgi:hypothetical protein
VNASAAGLVYTATYQLSDKALTIDSERSPERGTYPLGSQPLYVAVSACTFIGCGFLKVPPPVAIAAGGCVGLLAWAAA